MKPGDGSAPILKVKTASRTVGLCLAFSHRLYCFHRMQTETLSLRISKSESKALRQRAREEGVSRGRLVRRALRAYGVTTETEGTKSGYEVIKHLIGRNRGGAKDLSTHPRHLTEYGR
jgi:hypothetical protein